MALSGDFSEKLQRLYSIVSGQTFDNMLPRDVFELVLDYILPPDEAKEGAKRLEERFGSVPAAIEAPVSYISQALGGNEMAAHFFKLVPAIGSYYRINKINNGRRFASLDDIAEYCVHRFSSDRRESYRILLLDCNMCMLGMETLAEGAACEVNVDFEKIGQVVFSYNANAFLLIHNHPSYIACPSKRDEETTVKIYELFKSFNKRLVDHLLISGKYYVPIMQKLRDDARKLSVE